MYANDTPKLIAVLASCLMGLPLLSTAQTVPKAGTASPAASAAAAPASQAAGQGGVTLARPSDTIGAAADHQRTMRMLQSAPKSAASAPVAADTKVPAIQVERIPERAGQGAGQGARPAEPQMVLTEVLKGPTKLLAGIELNGVNRFVSVGEDVGNGWRVAGIDKYRAILQMPEAPAKPPAVNAKGKGKDVPAEPPKMKTLILPLGLRTVAAASTPPAPGAAPRN